MLALVGGKLSLYLHFENASAPAMLHCGSYIPFSLFRHFHCIENPYIVPPGYLCNNLLHKCFVRIGFRKRAHVLEIARGETFHIRKLAA